MLGFEYQSTLRRADAVDASAGLPCKRGARQAQQSWILESEPSVSKKVKRSSSSFVGEEPTNTSEPISFVERRQSVSSDVIAATQDSAQVCGTVPYPGAAQSSACGADALATPLLMSRGGSCQKQVSKNYSESSASTPVQHPAAQPADEELFDYYLSDPGDEEQANYDGQREAQCAQKSHQQQHQIGVTQQCSNSSSSSNSNDEQEGLQSGSAAASSHERGVGMEDNGLGQRSDSVTLEETERLVSEKRGCFARARIAAPVFFGNAPVFAPSGADDLFSSTFSHPPARKCSAQCDVTAPASVRCSACSHKAPQPPLTDTTLLEVRCAMGHCFDTTLRLLRQGLWCQPCERALARAREYAADLRGTLLSQYFDSRLRFECDKGHQFELAARDYAHKWCAQCKREDKQKMKQYLKQMEDDKAREYEQRQKELYDQARQQNSEQHIKKVLYAAKVVEKEVEKIAEQQAQEYLQREGESAQCSRENAVQVYKALLFPEQVMQYYYNSLDADSLKKEFRSQAKCLHPDKNLHPRAAEAFQKVYNYFKAASRKFE